ncbi:MAG: nucleoside/nucleotide kinase family protein [Rhodobacterales bacterium 32-67-9]|nr:MAG: nucleoside/nucleotide kinase family protein [Rhodobacterales bacterium 32-67-9]
MTRPAPLIDAAALLARLLAAEDGARRIVAIAGAPGSGKSTLAEALVGGANAARPGFAALLPMDGFHYDDRVLEARGLRPRKGAPETFDTGGLDHALARLAARDEAEVAVPVFDRAIEIARAGARIIPRSADLIVAEGNYLLLDAEPWRRLQRHFGLTVFLDVAEEVLHARLTARWQHFGLPPEAIRAKLEENDLPNARLVRAASLKPDFRLAG